MKCNNFEVCKIISPAELCGFVEVFHILDKITFVHWRLNKLKYTLKTFKLIRPLVYLKMTLEKMTCQGQLSNFVKKKSVKHNESPCTGLYTVYTMTETRQEKQMF